MGVGRAGQVLPGLTWAIVLSVRSRALRERSPARRGLASAAGGRGWRTGFPAGLWLSRPRGAGLLCGLLLTATPRLHLSL